MGSQLDLIGVHNNGLFYLQMRKGLDYLCANPHTDLSPCRNDRALGWRMADHHAELVG